MENNKEKQEPALLTKAEEIKLIEKLMNGRGYFAQEFSQDFQQIKSNISNDFPFMFNTTHEGKINELKDVILEMKSKHSEIVNKHIQHNFNEMNSLFEFMLSTGEELGTGIFEQKVINSIGVDETIKIKHRLNILSKEDINYLITKI